MLIFSLLQVFIQATPFGAPGCGINKTAITKGMGQESMKLGYKLDFIPAGGNTWNITIKNEQRSNYQGLLLYVSPITNLKAHLGEIAFKNQTKWKYQQRQLCESQGITGGEKSTVTHAIPDRVGLQVAFQWTGSDQEVGMDGLVVNAVVASLDDGKTGFPRWQKLEVFGIPPTIRNHDTTSPIPTATPYGSALPTPTVVDSTYTTTTTYPSQKTHRVLIGPGLTYSPPLLTVSKGDYVTWNFTSSPHTVTQSTGCEPVQGGFDSQRIVSPASFGMTVEERVEYMCTVGDHCVKGMKGVIEVQGDGDSTVTNDPVKSGDGKGKCYVMVLLVLCFL